MVSRVSNKLKLLGIIPIGIAEEEEEDTGAFGLLLRRVGGNGEASIAAICFM